MYPYCLLTPERCYVRINISLLFKFIHRSHFIKICFLCMIKIRLVPNNLQILSHKAPKQSKKTYINKIMIAYSILINKSNCRYSLSSLQYDNWRKVMVCKKKLRELLLEIKELMKRSLHVWARNFLRSIILYDIIESSWPNLA